MLVGDILKANNYIDEKTIDKIGLDYILDKLETLTPYGKEKRRNIKPFLKGEENKLILELNKLEYIINLIKDNENIFAKIKSLFKVIKDLKETINRTREGQVLTEIELFEIKTFLFQLSELDLILNSLNKPILDEFIIILVSDLEKLLDPLDNKIKSFYIYDDYSISLKNIRENKKNIQISIKKEILKIKESIEKDLKLTVKPNGQVVVSKADTDLINIIKEYPLLTYKQESYMDIKYSIKNNETINNLNNELNDLELQEEKEEYSIRADLSRKISMFSNDLYKNIDIIGNLDFIIAKALYAINLNCTKPIIIKEMKVNILEGRYIELEDILEKSSDKFTPISVYLDTKVTCITGANMGGKTVSLKLIGLLVSIAQYGLFVPCKEMSTCLFDFVYASIGDLQSVNEGLSTFGAEIKGLKYAINRSDELGLILIDELASGTNPHEGYAISKAIVEFLNNKNSLSIITTHYDNIASIEGIKHLQVVGLKNIDYNELKNINNNEIEMIKSLMDYSLIEVKDKTSVPKDAINIAKLIGLNQDIIIKAENILNEKLKI